MDKSVHRGDDLGTNGCVPTIAPCVLSITPAPLLLVLHALCPVPPLPGTASDLIPFTAEHGPSVVDKACECGYNGGQWSTR